MQAVAANALPTKVGVTNHMKYTYWNNNKNKISKINKLKIYVSLENLFSLKNMKVKDVIIEEANFNLNKNNYDFYYICDFS